MAYSFEELKGKKVAELREIAKGLDHEAVKGHTQMNKDHLLQALCTALGIEAHAHQEVVGIDQRAVKARIQELKGERSRALEARDAEALRRVRRRIRRLKRTLRRAAV